MDDDIYDSVLGKTPFDMNISSFYDNNFDSNLLNINDKEINSQNNVNNHYNYNNQNIICNTVPNTTIPVSNYKRSKKDIFRDRPITIANISNGIKYHQSSEKPIEGFTPQASWFDISTTHFYEKISFPEFFEDLSSNRTPELYIQYRNFMINEYLKNPSQYLSVTYCRNNLSGDTTDIIHVHSFLEYNGLINYAVIPSTTDVHINTNDKPIFQVISFDNDDLNCNLSQDNSYKEKKLYCEIFLCSICKQDCTKLRYQHKVYEDYYTCEQCYSTGKYSETMFSSEFDKIDLRSFENLNQEWTDDEVLRLLDAIEKYGDDWKRISDYVGNKSELECLHYFVCLPIEDEYYKRGNLMSSNEDDILQNIPFMNTENPIMTMLIILRDSISPQISSAAAKAALQTFLEQNSNGEIVNDENIRKATKMGIEGAIQKAKELIEIEDKEIQKLMCDAIDAQQRKIELKLSYFEKLENAMLKEQEKHKNFITGI